MANLWAGWLKPCLSWRAFKDLTVNDWNSYNRLIRATRSCTETHSLILSLTFGWFIHLFTYLYIYFALTETYTTSYICTRVSIGESSQRAFMQFAAGNQYACTYRCVFVCFPHHRLHANRLRVCVREAGAGGRVFALLCHVLHLLQFLLAALLRVQQGHLVKLLNI